MSLQFVYFDGQMITVSNSGLRSGVTKWKSVHIITIANKNAIKYPKLVYFSINTSFN